MSYNLLELIDLGLPIIPVCTFNHEHMSEKHIARCKCAGKTPLIKDWQSHSETTKSDLQSWIKSFKSFNIGLPLGEASGYCGIDVDGDEGVKLLLEMSQGDLPSTWEFATGAGSRLLYKIPKNIKTKKFKQTGEGKHEECALLCTGQQTVIPPSIHYTGKSYQWIEGHSPWDMNCAEAPNWLLEAIVQDDKSTEVADNDYSDVPLDMIQNPEAPSRDVKSPNGELDFEDEFGLSGEIDTEFQTDLPPEVSLPSRKAKGSQEQQMREQKAAEIQAILEQEVYEGGRDNALTQIVGHYCSKRELRALGEEVIFNICMQHNLNKFHPPLEEDEVRVKVKTFFQAELTKDAEFNAKKPTFLASKLAKKVYKYYVANGIHLYFDQTNGTYYYANNDKGPWICVHNKSSIQKWIRHVITSEHYGDPSWDKRSFIEEVRMAFEELFTFPGKTVSDFDIGEHSNELCQYIILNNGMLDWKEGKLVPWDPMIKTTIAFDIDYEGSATCPNFERYLAEWLPDANTRKVVQEFLGYCLIPDTSFRKSLFLHGKGRNGKSVLLEYFQRFFGKHSSALSYDGLFTRWGPATLKDKIVNIFDDTNVSFSKETALVKNLIAGGQVQAEYKGGQIFHFKNTARFIYSSQNMPKTSDTTLAWYDRWFFVPFNQTFKTSNALKTEMNRNMFEETAGIFNWMVEGLKRLFEQDEFTVSEELTISNNQYRGQNDSVTQFVQDMLTTNQELGNPVSITQLYNIYCYWSGVEHLREVSRKVFTTRVCDLGYVKELLSFGKEGNKLAFVGLYLNTQAESFIENAVEFRVIMNS